MAQGGVWTRESAGPVAAILAATFLLIHLPMSLGVRVPRDQDALQLLGLQYYFANHLATTGDLPGWIPYMTEGTVSHWWFMIQATPVFGAVAGLGKAVAWLPFHHLWRLSEIFQEAVLAGGIWMLATRFGASFPARCFALIAALGSAVPWVQPWWNLQQVWAFPLELALLDRWLETGTRADVLLALALLAATGLGGMPYSYAYAGFAVFLFLVISIGTGRNSPRKALGAFVGSPVALAGLLGLVGVLALFYRALAAPLAEIAFFSPGRGADARIALEVFLKYGDRVSLDKWWELLLGVSVLRDYGLYIGVLSAPFALVGALGPGWRRALPITLLAVLLLDFSCGGPTARLAFACWPTMSLFRHIGLTGPAVRVLLIVLAALGLDTCLAPGPERRLPCVIACAVLLGGTGLAAGLAWMGPSCGKAVADLVDYSTDYFVHPGEFGLAGLALAFTATLSLGAAGLLALAAAAPEPRRRKILVAVLVLHGIDLAGYRWRLMLDSTVALDPAAARALLGYGPMPFLPRRTLGNLTTERGRSFGEAFRLKPADGPLHERQVSRWICWPNDAFLFEDLALSPSRTDHWLLPFDRLLRLLGGQPVDDRSQLPELAKDMGMTRFPPRSALTLALTGVSADKLELHASARVAGSAQELADALRLADPSAPGLYVEAGPDLLPPGSAVGGAAPALAPGALRLVRFEADRLELELEPAASARARWLLYRDCWHPGWRAVVDGAVAPVLRANLAHKAVPLPPGARRVELLFAAPELDQAAAAAGLLCGILLLALPLTLVKGLAPGPTLGA